MMNWIEVGRKLSWPDLRIFSGMCLKDFEKVLKISPIRDLNP